MMATASQLLMRDAHFRMASMSAAAEAMRQCGGDFCKSPELERLAHDVAFLAAGLALKKAFDEDAEISRLRAENELYKTLSLKLANSGAMPFVFGEKAFSPTGTKSESENIAENNS